MVFKHFWPDFGPRQGVPISDFFFFFFRKYLVSAFQKYIYLPKSYFKILHFFRHPTPPLRNNLDNTIIGGDWNCILSQRDTESNHTNISKALLNLVNTLKLKDIWFIENYISKYTDRIHFAPSTFRYNFSAVHFGTVSDLFTFKIAHRRL